MRDGQLTRRRFLSDSSRAATAGWLTLQLPWLTALAACSRDDNRSNEHYGQLTPAEGRAMRAFAEQIIPSGPDGPGAAELGAVTFVDRAFGAPFFAAGVPIVRAGLADLDARAHALKRGAEFASLGAAQQIAIMRQIEHEPFFATARTLVLIGAFAEPLYGGNRGAAGWAMVGIDHRPSYTAPFGWYDAQAGTAVAAAPT
ncbi:MAG TPA: gluconate 2-dehydrogenase subunit 3 family protein [Gemmatimonadaceae bacterium]|nr:gluconate 2-dehydrogenase subunit 3 family protein [Gemmatimonadaceae bacterium]